MRLLNCGRDRAIEEYNEYHSVDSEPEAQEVEDNEKPTDVVEMHHTISVCEEFEMAQEFVVDQPVSVTASIVYVAPTPVFTTIAHLLCFRTFRSEVTTLYLFISQLLTCLYVMTDRSISVGGRHAYSYASAIT